MAKKLIDSFSPPPDEHSASSEDLLRCGWNRHSRRCKMPGSIKPQGHSHHLCRWHGNIYLFSDPTFANNFEEFDKWVNEKKKTWPKANGPDAWALPNEEIFRMLQGN